MFVLLSNFLLKCLHSSRKLDSLHFYLNSWRTSSSQKKSNTWKIPPCLEHKAMLKTSGKRRQKPGQCSMKIRCWSSWVWTGILGQQEPKCQCWLQSDLFSSSSGCRGCHEKSRCSRTRHHSYICSHSWQHRQQHSLQREGQWQVHHQRVSQPETNGFLASRSEENNEQNH